MKQIVGTYVQEPTVCNRQRWDNPVPMPCGHLITRSCGAYLGAHAHECGHDAFYVFVRGEDAVAFRCFHHKDDVL